MILPDEIDLDFELDEGTDVEFKYMCFAALPDLAISPEDITFTLIEI